MEGEMDRLDQVDHAFVFEFEKDFDQSVVAGWMDEHWLQVCCCSTVVYLGLVFSVQAYMKSRTPFNLRLPLAVWSCSLAVFSGLGAWRTGAELYKIFTEKGLYDSVCNPCFMYTNNVVAFWTWMMVVSKVLELLDTAFIVLRKQKLIFLHWYHHISVLWLVWHSYTETTSSTRWGMVMNYSVHSIMYTYYTLRAARVTVPRGIAMVITLLQLAQFVTGCYINFLAYSYKQSGLKCNVSDFNNRFCLFIYLSYFMLFAWFFFNSYFKPRSDQQVKKEN